MNRVFGIILIWVISVFGHNMFWTVSGSSAVSDGWQGFTAGQTVATDNGDNGSYGFWYDLTLNTISLSVSPDVWDIGEIEVGETRTMSPSERMEIFNSGNLHLNLGVQYAWSDAVCWWAGTVPALNTFVVRGRFQLDGTVPLLFSPAQDLILGEPKWADDGILGDGGVDIGLGEHRNLWLQFVSPTSSSEYGDNNMILLLLARANLR